LGKQHIGFQYMRDCITEIQKRRDERRNTHDDSRKREFGRGNGGGGDQRRDNSRDRDQRRRRDRSVY
jgi:hypothetical protein